MRSPLDHPLFLFPASSYVDQNGKTACRKARSSLCPPEKRPALRAPSKSMILKDFKPNRITLLRAISRRESQVIESTIFSSRNLTRPNPFRIILLPFAVAATPLESYSYEKIGFRGTKPNVLNRNLLSLPQPVPRDPNYQCFLSLTNFPAIAPKKTQCFLSLTDYPVQTAKKRPNVFYHLQAMFHVSTSLFYH